MAHEIFGDISDFDDEQEYGFQQAETDAATEILRTLGAQQHVQRLKKQANTGFIPLPDLNEFLIEEHFPIRFTLANKGRSFSGEVKSTWVFGSWEKQKFYRRYVDFDLQEARLYNQATGLILLDGRVEGRFLVLTQEKYAGLPALINTVDGEKVAISPLRSVCKLLAGPR